LKNKLRTFPSTQVERFENHSIKPPTYIKTNDFTFVFQEIVNTYGIPMHKEINPAVFAIVTFPFLFGVMFGDVGHGFLHFFVGALLCILHPRFKNNLALEGFFMMRYLFLMMGFFAMFCGLIYNEFFAIPMSIFGSSDYEDEVKMIDNTGRFGYVRRFDANTTNYPTHVYPFGFDPVWFRSDQLLSYTNNFKMKLAVVYAIV
jgi:V-type H+-transporting ATPase subunit a